MAVAFGTIVNSTVTTGSADSATSPSISTPATNPVVMVGIASSATTDSDSVISSLTITGFGGTPSEVINILEGQTTHARGSVWKIVAPTANTAGTVKVTTVGASTIRFSVVTFSDADQTDPSPNADAVSSNAADLTLALTAGNLTADDATFAYSSSMANNIAACSGTDVVSDLVDATGAINCAAAHKLGTGSVTFNIDAFTGQPKLVARIAAAAGAPASTSLTPQIWT